MKFVNTHGSFTWMFFSFFSIFCNPIINRTLYKLFQLCGVYIFTLTMQFVFSQEGQSWEIERVCVYSAGGTLLRLDMLYIFLVTEHWRGWFELNAFVCRTRVPSVHSCPCLVNHSKVNIWLASRVSWYRMQRLVLVYVCTKVS